MNTKVVSVLIIILIALNIVSCKEGKEGEIIVPEKENKNFTVEIDYNTSQKNMFILYFYEEKGQFFTADNAVWLGVHPNDGVQKATLEIPDERLPIDLRINFCFEELRGPVQFESITLKYLDLSFQIPKAQILEYFVPNEYIQYDAITGIATPIEVNGTLNPFFTSKDKLWNLIKSLNDGTLNKPETEGQVN